MSKYRSKPTVIRAALITGVEGAEATFDVGEDDDGMWLYEAAAKDIGELGGVWTVTEGVRVGTLEGVMSASKGDYVVCGTKGEIYPVKGDIFADIYEPLTRTG